MVGDEVWRQVALVEAHALDEVHLHAEGGSFFDSDDAVFADLVDGLGYGLADVGVGRRNCRDLSDLLLGVDLGGHVVDRANRSIDCNLDALLQRHWVGASGHVAQALANYRPRKHGGGGGSVAGNVVGLLCDLFDELGTDALVGVFELDLFGD